MIQGAGSLSWHLHLIPEFCLSGPLNEWISFCLMFDHIENTSIHKSQAKVWLISMMLVLWSLTFRKHHFHPFPSKVFTGLRVLFWAVVLLVGCMYLLGVVTRTASMKNALSSRSERFKDATWSESWDIQGETCVLLLIFVHARFTSILGCFQDTVWEFLRRASWLPKHARSCWDLNVFWCSEQRGVVEDPYGPTVSTAQTQLQFLK